MSLVPIVENEVDVILDIRYATHNNPTEQPLYSKPLCFLHEDAFEKLQQAIVFARHLGYRIKIFDAFRPLEAQQALWDHTPDDNFVSNPETGAIPHCRGVAVDLTLLDSNNQELHMGTGFDDFTPRSYHGNTEISKQAIENRLTLMGIMLTSGWDFYKNEWWHYQLFQPREYNAFTDAEAGTDML